MIVHGHLNYLFEIFIVLVGYVSSTLYEKGGGRGGENAVISRESKRR